MHYFKHDIYSKTETCDIFRSVVNIIFSTFWWVGSINNKVFIFDKNAL